MKVGDSVPVTIAGQTVGQAEITAIENDRATLKVPGWWVVMGIKTELTDERGDIGGATSVVIGEERAVETPAPVVTNDSTSTESKPTETPVETKVPLEGAGTTTDAAGAVDAATPVATTNGETNEGQ